MTLAQQFRDELISRHQLALDALDRQSPEIEAIEALATRLRGAGIEAKAAGNVADNNRANVRVEAQADSPSVLAVLDSLAIDHELIGHYDIDKHNNPAIDIYRVVAAGQSVIMVVQTK